MNSKRRMKQDQDVDEDESVVHGNRLNIQRDQGQRWWEKWLNNINRDFLEYKTKHCADGWFTWE